MSKERTISLAGTIAFHLLLILFLLAYYIKPNDKERFTAELSGVPVMLGNVANAYGNNEPLGRGNGMPVDIDEPIEPDPAMPNNLGKKPDAVADPLPVQPAKPASPPVARIEKPPVTTQDTEKTIAAEAKRKAEAERKHKAEAEAKRKAEAEAKRKAEAEAERKAREEADRKRNINSMVGGAFGNGSGNSGSRGNTQGQGTQGSPAGNSSSGKVSGIGGTGSYDLGGRGLGAGGLKLPAYRVDDYGTVVVDIIVDPQGNVIEATIGKGTNTTNSSLRNESISAARQTKFSAASASNNQKGTITYKFNLN